MMKRPIPLLYRGDAFSVITSSVEENDSITSVNRGGRVWQSNAVIAQTLNELASPRMRIRPLQPAPPPLVILSAFDILTTGLNQILVLGK